LLQHLHLPSNETGSMSASQVSCCWYCCTACLARPCEFPRLRASDGESNLKVCSSNPSTPFVVLTLNHVHDESGITIPISGEEIQWQKKKQPLQITAN